MRKLSIVVLGAVALAGLGIVYFSSTPAAEAIPTCFDGICPSGAPFTTATVWGKGSTCAAARSSASLQSYDKASIRCGGVFRVCNLTLVEHGACWFNGTQWVVDAHSTHNCIQCEDDGIFLP